MKDEKGNATNKASKIWADYENGLSYQKSMGFTNKFPEYERFKHGDQWPAPTERTKSLPRPVFNIIKMFVNNKKSNVLSQNVKLIFSPNEIFTNNGEGVKALLATKGADDFSDFANNLWYELRQDTLNDYLVDDAATIGTGILHYYWDANVEGGSLVPYVGALRGETIDPLCFFVANPQQTDVQKQEWIIIASREELKKVRKEAKAEGLSASKIELIVSDEEVADLGYESAKQEQEGTDKLWVLTRYFRDENGAVCYSRSTKEVMLVDKRQLTPNVMTEREKLLMEAQGVEVPEQKFITRYPVVVFPWQIRKKCIFGTGEVEGLIPNQKAVNFNMAMMLLSVQDNAWPKMLVKPGALQQKITNTPGEVLTDYYTSGDGIKYMQPPNFNYMSINLVDKVVELSRLTSGVTEVTTGESLGSNMAASAIIALQNQARVPIDNIQKRFYRCLQEVGLVWEQFFKTYYNTPRSITTEDANGNISSREFTGENYKDVEFSLKVDVSASSTYSESLALTYLDKMYDKGDITADIYIELAPASVVPHKEKLKQLRRQMMEQQMVQQMPQMGGQPMGGGQALPIDPSLAEQYAALQEHVPRSGVELPQMDGGF